MKTLRDTLDRFDEFRKLCHSHGLVWEFKYDRENLMNIGSDFLDPDIAVAEIIVGPVGSNIKEVGCFLRSAIHSLLSIQEDTISAFEYAIKQIKSSGCGN